MKPSVQVATTPVVQAVRFTGNGTGIAGTPTESASTGVTYVHQQAMPARLRPVSLLPQQQVNGIGGAVGGQVVIRRYPNSSVVQVRRIVPQQQQIAPKIIQHVQQVPPTMVETGVATLPNNGDKGKISPAGTVPTRPKLSSEVDSDELEGERNRIVGSGGGIGQKNAQETNDLKSDQTGMKRRRSEEDFDDDDERELLIDEVEDDEDDQIGDIIDDDEEGDEKSALELNGSGVDSDFLRHVIETQILNRHKTRIMDWDGTKGHMCQSCNETFLSEAGLEAHRNRRIHHIYFFCRYCKRDLSFFNKCRLLQHLRNHRVTPTVGSLQNCTMIRLLPESDYLHFKYEQCTSSSDEDDPKACSSSSGGSGNCSGSGSPPKRLKPSRFRRIARSSINGRESDNSPPPNVSRQIVAPPQLSSPPLSAENSTTTIVSTLNDSRNVPNQGAEGDTPVDVGSNKILNSSNTPGAEANGELKSSPVAVIKSTGNTASVIIPSPVSSKGNTTNGESQESPQIRICNLSQLRVVNENDDSENPDEFEGEEDEEDKLEIAPVITEKEKSPAPRSNTAIQEQPKVEAPPSVAVKKEYTCYKCDKPFQSAQEFFQHLEESEQAGLTSGSLHRCPSDDVPSWSQCKYVLHTKVFHEKSVPFMCPGCGKESVDYNSLLDHVANDCFYSSLRVRYMCAATDSKCTFSDRKSVRTESEIIDHLKKEHSRSVHQCLNCTQGFATENWLLKHLAEAHGIQLDESKGPGEREALIAKTTRPLTQCLTCNILFPNGQTYLQHVYINFHMHILHAKMLECQNCLEVFETNDELFTHRQKTSSCLKLDPFSMKIADSGADASENGQQPGTQPAITPIKVVTNAGATIIAATNTTQLKQLQTVTSQRSQPAAVVAVITTQSTINSNNCSQSTSTQQQPSNRSQPTMQPKQQQNNVNNASSMAGPASTGEGQMVVRKGVFENLLACQYCGRLVVFSSLRKHEDQCCGLSVVDPGFCLTCKQFYGDRQRLARHGIIHIQQGLPVCLFCNNRHVRPTHPKSTNPSAHENLYALKKHIYSNHTSKIVQFPFQCPLCSTWCPDKRACEFHIKDHQFKYRVKQDDPNPSPIKTTPEDLRKMVKIRQKGIDPRRKALAKTTEVYYCPVCKNREFAWESGLARHLKLVHQKNPRTVNLKQLKKPSTARRFVVKAPEHAGTMLRVGLPQSMGKPLLRNVPTTGTNLKSPGTTPLSIQRTRSSIAPMTTGSKPTDKGVTVSSTSSNNSFTSRFSSNIVLRKRLAGATTPTAVTGRRIIQSTGTPPQRQLPNTRLRSGVSNPSAPAKANTSPAVTTSTPVRPPSNFLQTRSTVSAAATPTSAKSCRMKDGTIKCLKCPTYSCKSEPEFLDHVKWNHVWPPEKIEKLKFGNNLEEPEDYWCPECNIVFVAKPSLVRHLKVVHDYISSAEEYMQKIGYDGKKPLKPHQCDVCYFQCADDREHQQHIRTHGMAFLRFRQRQNMSNK